MAAHANAFTLVEGSGHMGVGSVLGHNNAQIAAGLGVPVLLVANGGGGNTIDNLMVMPRCVPRTVHESWVAC